MSDTTLQSLMWAVAVSALAPILRIILPGPKFAPVVFMILGGILIGPSVLGLAEPADLGVLSDLGLGFLFLLAGYEIDPRLIRERPGRLAIRAWWVNAAIALIAAVSLRQSGVIDSDVAIAIGLTTTALGTLLPILRDANLLGEGIGSYIFAAGAAGEIFPIVAMAIFLSTRGAFYGLLSLVVLGLFTLALVKIIDFGTRQRWGARLGLSEQGTSQATLRWTLVVLVLLLLIAEHLSIDIVMGAFLAGMVLRYWSPGDMDALELKLDAVGYGVFIPIFFVVSGMNLDIESILQNPWNMMAFFGLLIVARAMPVILLYRRDLRLRQRWEVGLFAATALPLLVALSTVAVSIGVMSPVDSAALIGAGVLSVIVFPTVALSLRATDPAASAEQAQRTAAR